MQTNVETITESIFYIGFNEVKNIVMTLSVLDLFADVKSLVNFNVVELWKHSIAVGVITRHLGKVIGEKDVENFFLAGVLHDIGKLFFLKNYNDEYYDVIREVSDHNITITEAEEMVFGMNHCTVGHLLSEKWKLPATLKFSILYHQTGTSNGKTDTLVSCVHIADILARAMELGDPGDNLIPEPNIKVWDLLNLQPGTFTDMYNIIITDYTQSLEILLLK